MKLVAKGERSKDGIKAGDRVIYKGNSELVVGVDIGDKGKFSYLITTNRTSSLTLEDVTLYCENEDVEILDKIPLSTKVLRVRREQVQLTSEPPKVEDTSDNITIHKHEYNDTENQGIYTTGVLHEKPKSNIKDVCTFAPSNHYEFGDGLNCMTFIEEAVKDLKGIEAFYIANAIKYLFRTTKKNGDDDLKKAHNYITLTLKKRGLL